MAEGEKRRTKKKKKKSELGGYGVLFFPLLFSSLLLAPRPNTHGLEKGGRKIEKIAQSGNREGGREGESEKNRSLHFSHLYLLLQSGRGRPCILGLSASYPSFPSFFAPEEKEGEPPGEKFLAAAFFERKEEAGEGGSAFALFPVLLA